MSVLAVGAAVNAQQKRNLRARSISNRLSQQPVDFCAILALEAYVFRGWNIDLREDFVVLVGQLAQGTVLEGKISLGRVSLATMAAEQPPN